MAGDLLNKEATRVADRVMEADMAMADTEVAAVISVLPDRHVYLSSAIPVVVATMPAAVRVAEAIVGPIHVMHPVK